MGMRQRELKPIAPRNQVTSEPIGTCLLAESEIEPNHDVSPWLAGLFVVPEHRRKGAGAVLVRAIEDQARQRGFSRLYLYTTVAVEVLCKARMDGP
jgi:GNAT superfamily N-acetyltransferase